uniref:F-box domain-containing protein n=1 Tax=Timema poppense TaxID=170557 RepID=A0A7R9GU49_TIMPO|nr:unnamed protein product [Timema poppensis]
MPILKNPKRLYLLCLDFLVPLLENLGTLHDWDETANGPLDGLAGTVVEDLLLQAHRKTCSDKTKQQSLTGWNDDWKVFLTPELKNAILKWDKELLRFVSERCQRLRRILVTRWKTFTPETLDWLPGTVATLDFDGELFNRGRRGPSLQFNSARKRSWLPEAEDILKALYTSRQRVPSSNITRGVPQLAELHLGTVHVTPDDLRIVLLRRPNLRLLRHYQLVKALYVLHAEQWKNKETIPVYKLRNLDVDFSHVVRCRMSPEAVLAPDALQLAVHLCPEATSVRMRYDCSTPHDVLSPLVKLRRLKELSVVCVSSGERTLLDFSDIAPLLETHGTDSLTSLELKVIEEIDVHVIMKSCPRLERLVISGCGNVTPDTCPNHACCTRGQPSLRSGLTFRRLRYLFFADGDDFSWDHVVPQCFWYATLGGGKRELESSHRCRLEGVFLESPRIRTSTADDLFLQGPETLKTTPLFPELQVLSVCRYPELKFEHLSALCGLDTLGTRRNKTCSSLRFVRIAECELLAAHQEKRLHNMLKELNPWEDIELSIT